MMSILSQYTGTFGGSSMKLCSIPCLMVTLCYIPFFMVQFHVWWLNHVKSHYWCPLGNSHISHVNGMALRDNLQRKPLPSNHSTGVSCRFPNQSIDSASVSPGTGTEGGHWCHQELWRRTRHFWRWDVPAGGPLAPQLVGWKKGWKSGWWHYSHYPLVN